MKANRHLRIAVGLYGIIWVLSAITFWLFYKNSQMAMLHVLGKNLRNQFDETVIHMRARPKMAWLSLI